MPGIGAYAYCTGTLTQLRLAATTRPRLRLGEKMDTTERIVFFGGLRSDRRATMASFPFSLSHAVVSVAATLLVFIGSTALGAITGGEARA